MNTLMITASNLDALLVHLQEMGQQVYAPQKKKQQVDFEPLRNIRDVTHEYIQTTRSAKSVLFPPAEELLRYHRNGDEMQVKDRDLSALPHTTVFGVRPCDAAAIGAIAAVFTWDYQDALFKKRLENTTIITVACTEADTNCFCTSTGTGPDDTKGSDVVLTRLSHGEYLAEIITEKGKALQEQTSALWGSAPAVSKSDLLAKVEKRFDMTELTKRLEGSFDNQVWNDMSLRCLSCGACAYVCPVCSCFDIQDEGTQSRGQRLRCWDACGFDLFTLHTSGHNPRHVQKERWRQRLLHKFSYMPDRLAVSGCVGCGRCSRACPADMNILEQIGQLVSTL
jgi:sulfhydrogenase subunit beta (sulfur reductase)